MKTRQIISPSEKILQEYLKKLEAALSRGDATEHTHRPALKELMESLGAGIQATNEPKQITDIGKPDMLVSSKERRIGYIETKDVGKNLEQEEKSEQLERYRNGYPNFILTDYLEFRWYTDGALRETARLARAERNGKIKAETNGIQAAQKLLSDFLSHRVPSVGTPKELAQRMARITEHLRDLIVNVFNMEKEAGELHGQFKAFQTALIPGLKPESFADMYAQTIAYGLFAARANPAGHRPFRRQSAWEDLPKTNPFLRKVFNHIAGPDLDPLIAWRVDDLAQLLDEAKMDEVLKNFGKETQQDDPVIYFYQDFLKAYDPKMREMRGVYYTPQPVVSYIVRSVDEILKTQFGQAGGLSDPKVLILDPAAGTGSFLYAVIRLICEAIRAKGQKGMWDGYVSERLLPRLFGFELLMAPYSVAHLKLGLQLKEMGYSFRADQRLGIYLTNTLEEAIKKSQELFAQFIAEEGQAASRIKKDEPIMVVLGNPPYSGHSANKGPWISKLIEDYKFVDGKPLGEKNPKWLQDDYVKFIRFGQWRIEKTGQGILAFITNHGYLDNPTFRGMRQSLMKTFDEIYLLDLHGNSKKKEVCPDGSKDENVFDIQQGVAIGIFVKKPSRLLSSPSLSPPPLRGRAGWGEDSGGGSGEGEGTNVHHADLYDLRKGKYKILSERDISNTKWQELKPNSPSYLFIPQDERLREEYGKAWKITEIFPVNSVGAITARDELTVRWSKDEAWNIVQDFAKLLTEEAREKYNLGKDARDWKVALAQEDLKDSGLDKNKIVPILYRPFDVRYTYYIGKSRGFLCMPRPEVMRHMLAGENLALLLTNRHPVGEYNDVFVGDGIVEGHVLSGALGISYCFPLYLYPDKESKQEDFLEGKKQNLNPKFVEALKEKLGTIPAPEEIFHYIYAIFHSPTYRKRYAQFLKMDFPRVPLTSDKKVFKALAEKGAELVLLHLLESPKVKDFITKFNVKGSNEVERVLYDEKSRRVYINKEQHFEGVPKEVWEFQVGGYQVCEKWLKDRKGRKLSLGEIEHYQKIIVALSQTLRLMREIDRLLPQWPVI